MFDIFGPVTIMLVIVSTILLKTAKLKFGSMLPNLKIHCRGLSSRNHGNAHHLSRKFTLLLKDLSFIFYSVRCVRKGKSYLNLTKYMSTHIKGANTTKIDTNT